MQYAAVDPKLQKAGPAGPLLQYCVGQAAWRQPVQVGEGGGHIAALDGTYCTYVSQPTNVTDVHETPLVAPIAASLLAPPSRQRRRLVQEKPNELQNTTHGS